MCNFSLRKPFTYRAFYTLHRPLIVMHKDNVHFYQCILNLYTQSLCQHIHPLWFNCIISQAAKCYIKFFESRANIFYGASFPFTVCLCNIDQVPNRHTLPLVLLSVNSSTATTRVSNNKYCINNCIGFTEYTGHHQTIRLQRMR
jgi:hypothetical protein